MEKLRSGTLARPLSEKEFLGEVSLWRFTGFRFLGALACIRRGKLSIQVLHSLHLLTAVTMPGHLLPACLLTSGYSLSCWSETEFHTRQETKVRLHMPPLFSFHKNSHTVDGPVFLGSFSPWWDWGMNSGVHTCKAGAVP
jgi:hypothetical protein